MISVTEENYLKSIYNIQIKLDSNSVSTNSIADDLGTSAGSVTDMIKKLSDKELIHYTKYKGVSLTDKGKKIAVRLVRKHRLWEVFLVQILHFSWDEVHDIAEQLEHIDSDRLIDKLNHFLDYPKFDPHGDPIPDEQGRITKRKEYLVSEAKAGDKGIMVGVKEHSSDFLQFLDKQGINLGVEIVIIQENNFDKSLQIKVNNSADLFISHQIARNIIITKS